MASLSPPILATHRASTEIFTVGGSASVGIQQVAENGKNGSLRDALGEDKHVYDVVEASAPIVPASGWLQGRFSSPFDLFLSRSYWAKLTAGEKTDAI